MFAIAGVAVALASLRSCGPPEMHRHYWTGKAATSRRLERGARQQAAIARKAADGARSQARTAAGAARERFTALAKHYEDEAATSNQLGDEFSRDAVDYLKEARSGGQTPSEWPDFIRRELKPEDLSP